MSINTIISLTESENGYDITCSIRSVDRQNNRLHSYVTRVYFEVNDQIVTAFDTGKNISENPLFGIHLSSLKQGDRVSTVWISSNGDTNRASATVS